MTTRRIAALLATAALFGAACGDASVAGSVASAAGAAGRSAAVSPCPSVAGLPATALQLIDRVKPQSASIIRMDCITARLEKMSDFSRSVGMSGTPAGPDEDVWVVAVLGEVRSSFGITDTGTSPCGRWVYGANDLEVRGWAGGSLKACAPYFAVRVPPDEPVRCPPEPAAYAYRHGSDPASRGAVALAIQRDDAWQMPATVPGSFLYEGLPYYATFCRKLNISIVRGPSESKMLVALGSPRVRSGSAGGEIWLKGYHAIAATALADHVAVTIEPRAGFEIASFDWRALAPQGGYVRFEFRDARNIEVFFEVANGP
jgi:hypothetical protein